jgi:hypothetical protein
MIKNLLKLAVLAFCFGVAEASTVPNEGAYCLANCVNGVCVPVVANYGQANLQIGAPLLVAISGTSGTQLVPATSYSWAMTTRPDGTPGDWWSIPTVTTNTLTIQLVEPMNEGMYLETGFAFGGDTLLNWCVTVLPPN